MLHQRSHLFSGNLGCVVVLFRLRGGAPFLPRSHLRAIDKASVMAARSGPLTDVDTLEAWQWALAVVSSRALTFRGKRLLAPICDM